MTSKTTNDVIYIDDLVNTCGYFNSRHDVNNGYGCAHPKQESRQDGHGCCMPFSCPIAVELHPEDEPEDQTIIDASTPDGRHVDASNDGWMLVTGAYRKTPIGSW